MFLLRVGNLTELNFPLSSQSHLFVNNNKQLKHVCFDLGCLLEYLFIFRTEDNLLRLSPPVWHEANIYWVIDGRHPHKNCDLLLLLRRWVLLLLLLLSIAKLLPMLLLLGKLLMLVLLMERLLLSLLLINWRWLLLINGLKDLSFKAFIIITLNWVDLSRGWISCKEGTKYS
jgi:hypothetical protein